MTTIQYVYATKLGLYVTDGTSGNQTLIKATVAGTQTALGFLPDYAMAALPNNQVVFGATANGSSSPFAIIEGGQLWVTDGTSGGTTLLMDLPDPGAGNPGDDPGFTGFATAGTLTYGEYYDGSGDYFLVSTNGTQAGSTVVFNGLQPSSIGAGLGAAIGSSYVFADDTAPFAGFTPGLYISNGGATPMLVKAATAGTDTSLGFLPSTQMAALPDGEVVFGATANGSSSPLAIIGGGQLWVTNGTAGGTQEISSLPDLAAGLPVDNSGFTAFVTAGTLVYGEYSDGAGDNFLEATNGTQAGTNTILNGLDPASIGPGDGAAIGSNLVFTSNTSPYAGLYLANGNSSTATLIKATVAGTVSTLGFLPGDQMAALPDGEVVFGATANGSSSPLAIIEGIQLWVTDGTAADTTELMTLPDPNAGQPGDTAGLIDFVTAGNEVMFEYTDGFGDYFLYSTDGTAAGTTEIGQVDPSSVGAGDGAAPCFAKGTLIRTNRGQTRVEKLKIAEKVMTMSGVARPIKWIGRRSYSGRFVLGRKDVLPICIKAGALEDNVPQRDLWISPNHAMYLDGMLIEAKDLVNGVSIVQAESAERLEYIHIELDTHDVLIAEGALAESYIDDDNRLLFHNAHEYREKYRGQVIGRAQYYAPRCDSGYELKTVRQRIALRAGLVASDQAPPIGALRGYVDRITGECVSGWGRIRSPRSAGLSRYSCWWRFSRPSSGKPLPRRP